MCTYICTYFGEVVIKHLPIYYYTYILFFSKRKLQIYCPFTKYFWMYFLKKKMTYILIYKFISHQTQEININIILLYNYWSYWKFASSPNNVLSCPGSSAGSLIALNFHVSLSPLIWNNFSFRKIFYCSDNFEFYRPVIL